MSENYSVSDKLRACVDDDYLNFLRICGYEPKDTIHDSALAMFHAMGDWSLFKNIADEIDTEEAEMRGFCNRVEDAAKNREDLDVFGVEYMPLPLDKNGEPWHVGDIIKFGDDVRKVASVSPTHVIVHSYGITISVLANKYEHYKEPTVEDVLRVLIAEVCGDSSPDDEAIAKYAAKLRLKED